MHAKRLFDYQTTLTAALYAACQQQSQQVFANLSLWGLSENRFSPTNPETKLGFPKKQLFCCRLARYSRCVIEFWEIANSAHRQYAAL
jgi:hypothetical protein